MEVLEGNEFSARRVALGVAALALATESHEVASDLIVGVIAAEEDAAIAKGSRAEGDRRVHR